MRRRRTHGAAHEGEQLALLLIENKQLLRQRRLIVEHVHQEAHRAEVVAQLLERAGFASHGLVHLGVKDLVHRVAHACNRAHRLIQAEHGKHATHLPELGHGHVQARFLLGRAEKLIERLLHLAQRDLEFAHHAAHGLAVAHAAVELLHPCVQRLRGLASKHAFEPLGQSQRALGQFGGAGIEVLEGGLQVQGRGGNLHGQFRAHPTGFVHRLVGGLHQGLRQRRAGRVQLEQGVTDQAELIGHLPRAAGIATGVQRPHFLGGMDAFARLRQHGRVVAAQRGLVVVHRRQAAQTKSLAHRGQMGRCRRRHAGRLGAEEQQIVQQGL